MNSMIFFPAQYPDGDWQMIANLSAQLAGHPRFEDCTLTASDGVKLHGWYCSPSSPTSGAPRPVLLWFHGNAGNITHRYSSILKWVGRGLDVLIIDYRGYGRSEGKPDEAGLYRDAQAAWDFVIHDKSVAEQRVVIFGRSLGGAVAIDLAWRPSVKPAGLIIESSFTSVPDMVRHMIAIMPRLLVRTKMDSLSKITGVTVPKLFIHSRADEIIPYDQGRRLYDAAGEPKQFYTLDTAGHNETEMVGGEPYFNTLHTFITAQLSS